MIRPTRDHWPASSSQPGEPGVNLHGCAHAVVKLVTLTEGEHQRAWWACEICREPFAPVAVQPATDSRKPETEYLSIKELARRIPYVEGTIRNLMTQGKLRLGVHYVKKNNGRVMFIWTAMKAWVEEDV
jgi:hypothetical protein